jgi:death-on-curing protein
VIHEPGWLLESVVVAAHGALIAEHGGLPGMSDLGRLRSTLARPRNLLACSEEAPGLFALAASYAFGLARNHCFFDGNKRIALTAALTFLDLNGFRLVAEREETYAVTLRLAEGEMGEGEFSQWLAGHCVQVGDPTAPR